jgi:uncharacterized lipoprotein
MWTRYRYLPDFLCKNGDDWLELVHCRRHYHAVPPYCIGVYLHCRNYITKRYKGRRWLVRRNTRVDEAWKAAHRYARENLYYLTEDGRQKETAYKRWAKELFGIEW